MSKEEISNIVSEINVNKTGKIYFSEFIAASIDPKDFMTEERILAIFKTFDIDNNGEITVKNL